MTKADTINEGEAGTSPIFTVVGNAPVEITEKTGIPTVEKKIVSDADSKEHDAADSQIGQDVTYNLYGTIAENYDKYDTYFYEFSDQISKGLTLQPGARVYVYRSKEDAKKDLARTKGKDISSNFNEVTAAAATDGSKTTKWTCDDLKKVEGVNSGSCIVVSYKAQINKDAVVAGTEGNENTVTLNYSNNPMTSERGETKPDTVKDYTYGLRINKVDLGTEKALEGARFTIQATTADDVPSTNLYVQDNGSLGETPKEFVTNSEGIIEVTGLDAGTYTVTEVSAPSGYAKVDPFTFEIKPSMMDDDPDAGLTGLTGELTTGQGDKVIAGLTYGDTGDNSLTVKPGSEKTDGIFNITVGDTKQVGLPLTGLNGVTFTWIAGGAVLCIGVAHLIRSRKQAEESEQE